MDTKTIHDTIIASLNNTMSFPETVKQLMAIGIERYYADLVRMEKTFYHHNGETCRGHLTMEDVPELADTFNEEGVQEAVRNIQQGHIDYQEFLRRIIAKGSASYTVYLDGHFAAYDGRKGERYVEPFPSDK